MPIYMIYIRRLLFSALTSFIFFQPINFLNAEEKIVVTPLIKSSTGLEGKYISYPRGRKAELRLLKVKIPVGLRTPIHVHPAPMLIYVSQGKLKHVRGSEINFFSSGDSFIESNYGKEHYVISVGDKPAVLFVSVSSAQGIPTTINK
tara:strand:- start:2212 stop:2652 length:441 start_codon:yes stop_codon:yes gene_type:complete